MKDRQRTPTKVEGHFLLRVVTYIIGLFLCAVSASLAVMAGIGNTPANSVGVVSSYLSGLEMGDCLIIFYGILLLGQMLLLGKAFKLINLAQMPFAIIYGKFVNLVAWCIPDYTPTSYLQSLVILAVSVVVLAVGVAFFVGVSLVPMPLEGLVLVIAAKTGIPFHICRIINDCALVVLVLAGSWLVCGEILAVREGTLVLAVGTGWVIGLIKPYLPSWIQG
ncbi:hypothetical protein RFF05_11070 [Bengtsoniella intestinalis]|uniref:hypothetical protein n=1 Tax=Bengtsoniella intestinalis TaxID=3073143 RepID=UPI00391F5CC6